MWQSLGAHGRYGTWRPAIAALLMVLCVLPCQAADIDPELVSCMLITPLHCFSVFVC